MIYLIIKSYLNTLVPIAIGSLLLFISGLCFIFRGKEKTTEKINTDKRPTITADDIASIAGDDMLATQLDLALAYIETGKKQSAKDILDVIVKQGNASERAEAHRLLSHL